MASDPEERYVAENSQLRATLGTLSLQHSSNLKSGESGAHELANNLKKCREMLGAISLLSVDLESLEQLYESIPDPKSAECSKLNSALIEDFQNFIGEVENCRVGLESDFVNKINGTIFEIGRKLGEYESYIGFVSRGQMMTNSTILNERIGRFKEDIFEDLEPAIRELFTTLISEKDQIEDESPIVTPTGSMDPHSPEETPETEKRMSRSSSTGSEDIGSVGRPKAFLTTKSALSLPRGKKDRRSKTVTAYTYKMKNTENVTKIQQGHRISEIAKSWNDVQVKTQVYFLALHFRLKERELSKDMLQKGEKWYSDHKDLSDTRQLIRDYEEFFINNQFFDGVESHLRDMNGLCSEYEGYKAIFQIPSFQYDQVKDLYLEYQKKYKQLRMKIEELVPYLKATAYENLSTEIEEKYTKIQTLLLSLLSTVNSLRENQQGINVNITEKLSEIQNELTSCEQLMERLTNEFECLSQSLIEKKKDHYENVSSTLVNHQSDFNSCKQNLINIWVSDTESNFFHKNKIQTRKMMLSGTARTQSEGEETVFLIKQAATKESKDEIWAPSLNLTNMNAALEILGEMFGDDEGEDGNEAEEMLACALDLLDALLTWAEEKRNVVKNSQSEQLDLPTLSQEFFRIQGIRGALDDKLEEFEKIKTEYVSVLNESHYMELSENLAGLSDELDSREQSLSVLLVFLQDFDKSVRESVAQLDRVQNAVEAIFRNKTDITQGVVAFEALSADLSDLERGISKMTRKSIGIKKRFPNLVLNSETADLPDRFLSLKREVGQRLTEGKMGVQQLSKYSDQLEQREAGLEEFRKRTHAELNAPLVIGGAEIDDTKLKELETEIEEFRKEFESIAILEEPPCTELTIPTETLSERESILRGLSDLHDNISAWSGHVMAIKLELSSIQSKFS